MRESIDCPDCYDSLMVRTSWQPPAGLDPTMVQYKCTELSCSCELYVVSLRRAYPKPFKKAFEGQRLLH